MARSTKKGPYVDPRLLEKVTTQEQQGTKKPIRTWARSSLISPEMVGFTFQVHNGRDFLTVFVMEAMIGHRLGEFSLTRRFSGHSKKGAKLGSTGEEAA